MKNRICIFFILSPTHRLIYENVLPSCKRDKYCINTVVICARGQDIKYGFDKKYVFEKEALVLNFRTTIKIYSEIFMLLKKYDAYADLYYPHGRYFLFELFRLQRSTRINYIQDGTGTIGALLDFNLGTKMFHKMISEDISWNEKPILFYTPKLIKFIRRQSYLPLLFRALLLKLLLKKYEVFFDFESSYKTYLLDNSVNFPGVISFQHTINYPHDLNDDKYLVALPPKNNFPKKIFSLFENLIFKNEDKFFYVKPHPTDLYSSIFDENLSNVKFIRSEDEPFEIGAKLKIKTFISWNSSVSFFHFHLINNPEVFVLDLGVFFEGKDSIIYQLLENTLDKEIFNKYLLKLSDFKIKLKLDIIDHVAQ